MNKKAVSIVLVFVLYVYIFADTPVKLCLEDIVAYEKGTDFQYSFFSNNEQVMDLFKTYGLNIETKYSFDDDRLLISDSEVEYLSYRRCDRIWVWHWGQDILRVRTSPHHDKNLYVYRIPSRFILEEFSR